jgi:hypothetical protein
VVWFRIWWADLAWHAQVAGYNGRTVLMDGCIDEFFFSFHASGLCFLGFRFGGVYFMQ